MLSDGLHTWWIQTWNEAGYGPWSAGLSFWVGLLAPPGPAMLVSPLGSITDTTPTYVWDEVPSVSWYRLWVEDALGAVIKAWYRAEDICAGGMCEVEPGLALDEGYHIWWVGTWNIAGFGPWSAPLEFYMGQLGLADPAALIVPVGMISDTTPVYTWGVVSTATWYRLLVEGPSGTAINQ